MPLTDHETELYDVARDILPRFWFHNEAATQEHIFAFVKVFDQLRDLVDVWVSYAFILSSVTMWLDQHAYDRGTSRQADETDVALRERIRNIDDAVTPAA